MKLNEYDDDFNYHEPWKFDPMDIFSIIIVAFVSLALLWGLSQI